MADLVLDTNIVMHYLRRNHIYHQVEQDHALTSRTSRPILCAVTLGELRTFTNNPAWSAEKRQQALQAINQYPVIDIRAEPVVAEYALLHQQNKRQGLNIGHNDLWIAATGLALDVPVMTTDFKFKALLTRPNMLLLIDPKTGAAA